MQAERRKVTRFSTSIPVGLRFPSGAFQEGWGRILNLSPEGLFLETRYPIKVADVIYASFALKDGAKFENLRSHVIRVQYEDGYYSVAIAFDDVVDQDTLREVLAALAFEAGTPLS